MSDVTPTDGSTLAGILIPECCVTVWAAETTLDEAEARPGQLAPDRTTRLRVIPTGEPVTGEAWEIQASVGGVPGGGRNDDAGGARFLQRPTTDPVASWRGMDPPTSISSVDLAGSVTNRAYSPTAVQTADGREVVVVEDHLVGSGYNTKVLKAFRRAAGGSWGSAITIATFESLGEAAPCLVLTESGRLDVYALDAIDSTRRVVRYSSDDDGATWELSASSCLRLEAVSSATAVRLRVAAGGGQVLLIALFDPSVDRKAQQYASSDDGATFQLVSTYDDVWCSAVCYDPAGLFRCLWIIDDTSGINAVHVGLGRAFEVFAPTAGTVIGSDGGAEKPPILTLGGGIWTDAAGVVYVCYQTVDNAGTIDRNAPIWASADGGLDWSACGSLFNESTEGEGWIHDLAIRRTRSGAIATWRTIGTGGGTARPAVYAARLGGWSTSTMPGIVDQPASPLKITAWERAWVANADQSLEDGGTWTESLTGAVTKTLGSLSWRISGTSAMHATYVYALTGNSVHGQVRLAINPTGGAGTAYITLTVAQDSSPDRTYEIRAEFSYALGTYQIIDVASAAVLFGPSAIPASTFELWMAIGRKNFTSAVGVFGAFARRRLVSGDPEDRAWAVLVDAPTLTVATATDPNTSKVTIRTNPGVSAAFDLTLQWVAVDLAGVTGAGLGLADSTERLFGAPFTPRAQYVRDGVSVHATGLVRRLDSWTQTTTYAYGVEQALPTVLADPRRGHKATTADDGFYAFQLEGGDCPRGGLWAIYLDGITWDQVAIAIRTGGIWETLGTVTMGEAIEYASEAGVSYADEAPDVPRYYAEDELAGSWIEDGPDVYTIQSNSEGVWSTTGQRAELKLDTDGGAASNATLRFRRGLILLYFAADVTFEAIRLGPEKILGDVESAIIAFGRVRVLGDGWDATVSRTRDLGQQVSETSTGGGVHSRPRADRRVVELAHSRAVPTGDPGRYVRALSSGPAVATAGDPAVLDGIVGAAGKAPVVLIPSIPVLAGSATRILAFGGGGGAVYGRFAPDTYRRDTVYTDGHGRDALRGSVVTIVEEVG